jgi:VanZ family protein
LRKALIALGCAYAGLIVYFSLISDPPHVAEFQQGDKLKHLGAYGLLMFYFARLYLAARPRLAHALAFCAMGISIEYLQRWGGVRTFEVADMAANACGVGLGWWAATFFKRNRYAS